MDKYEKIKDRKDGDFKRLTGVRKKTFQKMLETVILHEKKRKKISGRPLKLNYENQILMMLEYLREYRTYYHIAADYGISEANCYKLIKRIEEILVKSEYFRLPDRKLLADESSNIEVVIVDETEIPIERPQKTEIILLRQKEKAYFKGTNTCK